MSNPECTCGKPDCTPEEHIALTVIRKMGLHDTAMKIAQEGFTEDV